MTIIDVYLCQVTPSSVSAAGAYISPDEALCAARYRSAAHCASGVLAHGMKRRQLSRATGIRADQLRLAVSTHGKPVLENFSAISFNLAHAGVWVALALSREGDVGIDIEPEDRDFDQRLYEHALNDSERSAIEAANDMGLAFLICWTQKESVLKALGEPMAYQPKRVSSTARLGASSAMCGTRELYVFSMRELGCVVSVASALCPRAIRVTHLEPCGSNDWTEHVRRNIDEVRSNPQKNTSRTR